MTKTLNLNQILVAFGIPLMLILSMVLLTQSNIFTQYPKELSLAITLDLLITIPIVYFLLIRKKTIPNLTVVTLFIIGIVIASFIIPKDHQFYLTKIKYWVLPLLELTIFSIIVYKVHKTIKQFKEEKNKSFDFFSAMKKAAQEVMPKRLGSAFATEISMFYYAFLNWKTRTLLPNEFSYHKKNGTVALLSIFIFIIMIESTAMHFLIHQWNVTAAWILTILSVYSGFQILGITRAITKRPISIETNRLELRYSIFAESTILFENIEKVEYDSKPLEKDKLTKKLSLLGDAEKHNVVIYLKEENILHSFYGIRRKYKIIALNIDEQDRFKKILAEALETI